jgi:hypothetical protein
MQEQDEVLTDELAVRVTVSDWSWMRMRVMMSEQVPVVVQVVVLAALLQLPLNLYDSSSCVCMLAGG